MEMFSSMAAGFHAERAYQCTAARNCKNNNKSNSNKTKKKETRLSLNVTEFCFFFFFFFFLLSKIQLEA